MTPAHNRPEHPQTPPHQQTDQLLQVGASPAVTICADGSSVERCLADGSPERMRAQALFGAPGEATTVTTYKGYSGVITISDDAITITRSGIAAKVLGNTKIPERVVPLAALSGVGFKDANVAVNGFIQLGFAGRPLTRIEGPSAAGGDPDTVVFTFHQRKAFAELRDYLDRVASWNLANGVDVVAAYQQAATTTSEKFAAKLGEAGEREDVLAAASRLSSTLGSKREIKKLPEHLAPGETVAFMSGGRYDKATGLVVLTDRRLLFLRHGLIGNQVVDFPLRSINSVQTKSTALHSALDVFASGNRSEISHIPKGDLKPLADAIRAAMNTQPQTPPAVTKTATEPDTMGQIAKLAELHAAGVLTDEEFAAKKEELLKRI